jgi:hypothetical protein
MQALRNRADGYWVASTDSDAAEHAITGNVPTDQLRTATLLSDGASRAVDRFHLSDWTLTMADLREYGPQAVIRRVRETEYLDLGGQR